jgi:hypothetical protein
MTQINVKKNRNARSIASRKTVMKKAQEVVNDYNSEIILFMKGHKADDIFDDDEDGDY